MANRYAFESVNKTFQDIMENMLPFGGKTMIFGGDFRQVLPVVKKGSAREQIAASISRSTFWNDVNVIHLYQNMRSVEDIEFSQLLLRIGDGLQHCVNGDFIKLPDSMVIPWENEHSISQLIDFVFPDMVEHINDANYMVSRAIITPKNADVDKINELLISKFPGEEREYASWDTIEDDNNNLFQEEFLNTLSPSGLPLHRIVLKVGCPIMLLRNVGPELGLCNGTRLICRNLYTNFIDAEIIAGPHKGTRYFLHRMPLKSELDSGLPLELTRKQFPIRLSFALTINKAQGKTIPNVGIFLHDHVFSHGQLYVALSRGHQWNNLTNYDLFYTNNIHNLMRIQTTGLRWNYRHECPPNSERNETHLGAVCGKLFITSLRTHITSKMSQGNINNGNAPPSITLTREDLTALMENTAALAAKDAVAQYLETRKHKSSKKKA
ncbi:uncharacterized protein [Henckelia pumila]|uniref:uncharacterized protein n=1 Tax=Henckelia pumila TaxID=405737 RepID=UPI003C6E6352